MIRTKHRDEIEIVGLYPDYEESGWVWCRYVDEPRVRDFRISDLAFKDELVDEVIEKVRNRRWSTLQEAKAANGL